jgi:hypothetical protein
MAIVLKKKISDDVSGNTLLSRMSYAHRVVILDDRLELLDVSEDFSFESEKIKFCTELVFSRSNIVLSYGVWDNQAWLMRPELKTFLKHVGLQRWCDPCGS